MNNYEYKDVYNKGLIPDDEFQEKWQELERLENNRFAELKEVRSKKALKAVDELLDFVDNCRPSIYTDWRSCEKEEMSAIILKYL